MVGCDQDIHSLPPSLVDKRHEVHVVADLGTQMTTLGNGDW